MELLDQKRFPNLIGMYPSSSSFTSALTAVVQYYGWTRIAFLTQNLELFTDISESALSSLKMLDVDVKNKVLPSFFSNTKPKIDLFSESNDYRIFFINTHSHIARRILCEAYVRGYRYPNYMWLTHSWYKTKWWAESINQPEPMICSDDQLESLLRGTIAIDLFPSVSDSTAPTDVGLTREKFLSLYRARLKRLQALELNYTYTVEASAAYDGLWTLAFALNKTNEMISTLPREDILNITECEGFDVERRVYFELVSLENFTHSNHLMGCIIKWNLERTKHVGVSSKISFDSSGLRTQSTVNMFQYRFSTNSTLNLSLVKFASSGPINGNVLVTNYEVIYLDGESNSTVFPQGHVPSDGTPVTVITTYQLPLVVLYYLLATAGLIFTTICLVFNCTQRNKKVVKLTSPNINYFIVLAFYLIYVSIFFRVMPGMSLELNTARCILYTLLGKVGYSFAFGAIVAKMGRIYYIFSNPTTKKKQLTDWKLTVVVLIISGIGALFGVLQPVVPSFRADPTLRPNKEFSNTSRNEFGIRIQYVAYGCYTKGNIPQYTWVGLTHAYEALLLIIGIIFAIKTRKVKIKLLNDSKYVAGQIYVSAIALFLLVILTFTLDGYQNISEAVVSGGILLASTVFLALAFVPKMVSLYHDPHGERVLNTTSDPLPLSSTVNTEKETTETHLQLQARIAELEGMLNQQNVQMCCCTCHNGCYTTSKIPHKSDTVSSSVGDTS